MSVFALPFQGVEASVNGVLGGYGFVSSADVDESLAFLHDVYGQQLQSAEAAERPTVALGTPMQPHIAGPSAGAPCVLLVYHFVHLLEQISTVHSEPISHFGWLASVQRTQVVSFAL